MNAPASGASVAGRARHSPYPMIEMDAAMAVILRECASVSAQKQIIEAGCFNISK
jgi:hypothetical protein